MDRETVLKTLLKLEEHRIKAEKKEIPSSMDDYTIRVCQSLVAEPFFKDRKEWTKILVEKFGLVY